MLIQSAHVDGRSASAESTSRTEESSVPSSLILCLLTPLYVAVLLLYDLKVVLFVLGVAALFALVVAALRMRRRRDPAG